MSVTPVESIRNGLISAFSVRLENGSIWIATGMGKFNSDWSFADDSKPLAVAINEYTHWMAVGTCALTSNRVEEMKDSFRHLAVQLNGGRAKAFYSVIDWSHEAFFAKDELLTAWQESSDGKPLRNDNLSVKVSYRNKDLITDREFERQLRQAFRTFKSSDDHHLEVLTCLSKGTGIDPLRMVVKSVKRRYNSLQFEGHLAASSQLIPELREGLNVRLTEDEICAWQLNSEPPVIRVQTY